MDQQQYLDQCNDGMNKRLQSFERDLTRVRTGRASITMLDGVKVDYYGSPAPINQVASLSTPDARTILISPFEKTLIQGIEKAIMKADLGVQPTNDGVVIRVPIPQLTEERRKDIVRQIKKMAEEAKVGLRQVRRDVNEALKKAEKAKEISEDESKQWQGEVQKVTDSFVKKIDDKLAVKEKEVMTV
jgi:ribosome recycling factor